MKTTYVLKEILVQYCCIHCQHTLWKTNKKSKLFPSEFIKECGNLLCPSHKMAESIEGPSEMSEAV